MRPYSLAPARVRAISRLGVITAVVSAVLAAPMHAQSATVVVVGSVVDSASALPVPNAEAVIVGGTMTRTDSVGGFQLAVAPGRYLFRVRRLGFEPRSQAVEIGGGADTVTLLFVLAEANVSLPAVLVEAREQKYSKQLAGFAQRMRTSGAPMSSFITREEIESKQPRLISDLLRTRSARVNGCSQNGRLIVDGISWDWGQRVRARRDPARSALDEFPVADIEAMEIYAGASQIPAQFNMTTGNGRVPGCVVVIWTRGGAPS